MTIPTDVLVDKYRQLRDLKKAAELEYKTRMAPVNEAMGAIENHLLLAMQQSGQQSIKTENGTAYQSRRSSYSVQDPVAFREWVEAQGKPEFFENRVSKDTIEAWIGEGNQLPPGIKMNSDITVNIRK